MLPEDKAEFVRNERAKGHKVVMIGDGVNDTPALSEADVGIAILDGAPIAREIADITIASDDLRQLITLRKISTALMKRIKTNYRFILGFKITSGNSRQFNYRDESVFLLTSEQMFDIIRV